MLYIYSTAKVEFKNILRDFATKSSRLQDHKSEGNTQLSLKRLQLSWELELPVWGELSVTERPNQRSIGSL